MSGHPLGKAREMSAIVDEDKYNLLIDLTLSAKAMWNNLREPEPRNDRHYYDSQKYRYMIWSSLESYLVGVVEEQDNGLELTLMGYGFKEMVTLENVIEIAATSHEQWSRSSLDPSPTSV